MTALDVALLSLPGTELVILSACDSGTGEVRISMGVMSMRRAFRIAGAATVLATGGGARKCQELGSGIPTWHFAQVGRVIAPECDALLRYASSTTFQPSASARA